uniref:Uncharacterized protein n=1 Tax=Tetraselmis sp. GSL018 TaxID=582737 RepID=A0A061RSK1_9CHLO
MEIASQILKLLSTAFCAAGAVVMTLAIFTPHTLLIKDIQAETALGWPLASVWLGFLSGELIIQTPLTKPVLEPFQYDNSFLCRDVCYNLRMGGRGAVVGLTTAAALLVAGATLSSVSLEREGCLAPGRGRRRAAGGANGHRRRRDLRRARDGLLDGDARARPAGRLGAGDQLPGGLPGRGEQICRRRGGVAHPRRNYLQRRKCRVPLRHPSARAAPPGGLLPRDGLTAAAGAGLSPPAPSLSPNGHTLSLHRPALWRG